MRCLTIRTATLESTRLVLSISLALLTWPASARSPDLLVPTPLPTWYADQWLADHSLLLSDELADHFRELVTDAQRIVFSEWFWQLQANASSDGHELSESVFHGRLDLARWLDLESGDPRHDLLAAHGAPDLVFQLGGCRPLDWWRARTHAIEADGGDRCHVDLDVVRYETAGPDLEPLVLVLDASGPRRAGSRSDPPSSSGDPQRTSLCRVVDRSAAASPSWRDRLAANLRTPGCRARPDLIKHLQQSLKDWQELPPPELFGQEPLAPDWLEFERRQNKLVPDTPKVSWTRLGRIFEPEFDRKRVGSEDAKSRALGHLVVQIPDDLAASRGSWLELTVSFVSDHRSHMYVMERRRAKVVVSALPHTPDGVKVLSLVTAVPGEGARLVVTLEGESQLQVGTFRISPGGRSATDGDASHGRKIPRLWPWDHEHGIRLSGFAGSNVAGQQRVEVAAWGPDAASVEHVVDGEVIARTTRPPFETTVDFGKTPLRRRLEVLLKSRDGRSLARDAIIVNPSRGRLKLGASDLGLDRMTSTFRPLVTALPGAEDLPGQLEVSADGQLIAVLDQHLGVPRLELPSLVESATSLLTLRATTRNGQSREITRVLDSSVSLRDSVEVDLVELFFTLSSSTRDDRQPFGSLATTDIGVFENGKEQTLRSLGSTHDLPLNAMIMVDVSRSLSDSFDFIKSGITAFLDDVLRPADRAGIVAMSEQTEFLTPLTASPSRLRAGLQRLQPGRGTAIWDGVAATARYLADQGGKRAIVIVSDGKDLHSQLSRKQAIAVAQDAGVTVHTIEIAFPAVSISGWPKQDDERRVAALGALNLSRLARTTGGLALRVRGEGDLERAYDAIETDLRHQYLAVYQSTSTGSGFRKIEIRSASGELDFRAPEGYYP